LKVSNVIQRCGCDRKNRGGGRGQEVAGGGEEGEKDGRRDQTKSNSTNKFSTSLTKGREVATRCRRENHRGKAGRRRKKSRGKKGAEAQKENNDDSNHNARRRLTSIQPSKGKRWTKRSGEPPKQKWAGEPTRKGPFAEACGIIIKDAIKSKKTEKS